MRICSKRTHEQLRHLNADSHPQHSGETRVLGEDRDGRGGGRGREEAGWNGTGFQSPTEAHSGYYNPPAESSSSQRRPPPGPRYHCTYTHPFSGKRCVSWVQGFSSQSDLSRHYMNIHGQGIVIYISYEFFMTLTAFFNSFGRGNSND